MGSLRLSNRTEDGIHSPDSQFRAFPKLNTHWREEISSSIGKLYAEKKTFPFYNQCACFKNQRFPFKESMTLVINMDEELEENQNVLSFFLKLISLAMDGI